MNDNRALTEGRIIPALLSFTGPFLLAGILQALYGAVDLLIIGQFCDSAQVAAAAIGGQVMQTVTGIVMGISTGGTVVIGQYIGARQKERAASAVGSLTALFLVLAAAVTVLMVLLVKPIAAVMQTPAQAMEPTVDYLLICSLGVPFIAGYNGISGVFRGFGDSKTPLYFIALACAVNIALDLLLVAGFSLGAAGAAAATAAAQGISFAAGIFYLIKKGLPVPFTKKQIGFHGGQALRILRIGSPIAVQDALVNISFLIITAIINTMGLAASASVGIDEKIIIFAMLVPTSFASAVSVMTAQNIGAGRMDRAKKGLWTGVGFSFIFGLAFWLYCQFSAESLTALFSKDPQVIAMAALYLKNYAIDCMLVAFIFCANAFFSGCGYSLFSLIHSLLATFGVRVPVSYFLSKVPGITLFEMGFVPPLATCLSVVLCLLYLNLGKGFKDGGSRKTDESPAAGNPDIQ